MPPLYCCIDRWWQIESLCRQETSSSTRWFAGSTSLLCTLQPISKSGLFSLQLSILCSIRLQPSHPSSISPQHCSQGVTGGLGADPSAGRKECQGPAAVQAQSGHWRPYETDSIQRRQLRHSIKGIVQRALQPGPTEQLGEAANGVGVYVVPCTWVA